MTRARDLEPAIEYDTKQKMVFLVGPRQVGKTTLGKRILDRWSSGVYLNWDNREHRRRIRSAEWPAGPALIVLDELHKWRAWKGWIKGEFDEHKERLHFLVTGSARMDTYRRGGDSLQGRYHHYRLHPFSLAEAQGGDSPPRKLEPGAEIPIGQPDPKDTLSALMRFGGFPEPFLAQSSRTHRRWQKERFDRFIREDVRDLEAVRDLSQIQILADLLPERVASPLSLNSLREDLEVSHRAVTHWMDILERLYFAFRVPPFDSRAVRSLKKMPKVYLWDWSAVEDEGARFENLVALHLLKLCHFLEDSEGHRVALHYLRDRAGHEVDFLVTLDRKPWFAVEAKLSSSKIEPSMIYFRDRLAIPWTYQVTLNSDRDYLKDGIHCLPATRFLASLV
ncbi:ATP-binding protein [bacterium]|nr:ATP-binding protein [bacterium]